MTAVPKVRSHSASSRILARALPDQKKGVPKYRTTLEKCASGDLCGPPSHLWASFALRNPTVATGQASGSPRTPHRIHRPGRAAAGPMTTVGLRPPFVIGPAPQVKHRLTSHMSHGPIMLSTEAPVRNHRNAVRHRLERCPPSIGTAVRDHRNPQMLLLTRDASLQTGSSTDEVIEQPIFAHVVLLHLLR